MSLRVKIVLIITSIVGLITASSMGISTYYNRLHLVETIESDMTVVSQIGVELISANLRLWMAEADMAATAALTAARDDAVSGGDQRLQAALEEQLRIHDYLALTLLDSSGVIASRGDYAPDSDFVRGSYARRAFAGEWVVTTTELAGDGRLLIRICAPMDSRILVVTLPGMILSDIISEFRIWTTGNLFLMDAEGIIIANIRPFLVEERRRFAEEVTVPETPESERFFAGLRTGKTGTGMYRYEGISRVAAYTPITGFDDWMLVAAAPIEESPGARTRDILIISAAVFMGLGILAAFAAAGVIAKPFQKIQEQNMRLKELKEAAENASRAKSDFLARMSHEIRTPLNAVLGLSEVEIRDSLPEKTRLNLEKIYHSGSHLLEIANDILDISKIESGNFEIAPAEYELYGVINDVIQMNIVRIGIKPIEFTLEIDETIPSRFYGDELRIRQILNNLLSNAFKYTEEGRVCLAIGWEQREDTALLWFTVEDTGRGIKKEDLEKLFSEYAQFEAAANRRIEGTGLGLSITWGLVETMGGSITVESEYGTGSVFRLQLPQGIVNAAPIGREMAEDLRNFRFLEARNRSRGNTLIRSYMPYGKVLVVDDLQTNLDVMTGLLMPYGLTVDTVLSGREAVEAIRNGEVRYDLVFMDHMMPEMDGIEATEIIRKEIDGEYALIVPIIALTANAVAGKREMFLTSGFTGFISKPVDIYQLDMVLNRWIRDKQSEETLREAEKRNLEQREADGGFNKGQLDAAGEWLLAHPVDGVELSAALKLYGNSGAAYLRILRSFVTHMPLLLEKMDLHLETSLPDYAIEVHGLKGTCSAIGAGGTAALGRELELAAKEGNSDLVRRKHGTLRREALELTGRLKVLVEEWEGGQGEEEKEGRAEPERALLVRLSAAAAEFNSNAAEELLGELERYRYERGEEFIAWLREAAESFDYEAMRKRLEEFLDRDT